MIVCSLEEMKMKSKEWKYNHCTSLRYLTGEKELILDKVEKSKD